MALTRCQLLLSLLEDAGERGITTSEILEAGVGSRYGARLMELRKAGHSITSERVREGSWKYTLECPDCGGSGHWYPRDPNGDRVSKRCMTCRGVDAEVGGDGVNKEPTYDSPHVTADLSALKLFESAA